MSNRTGDPDASGCPIVAAKTSRQFQHFRDSIRAALRDQAIPPARERDQRKHVCPQEAPPVKRADE